MTIAFDPVEELRRNGLVGDDIPPATRQVLGSLSKPRVEFLVQAQRAINVSSPDGPSLPLAMTRAMGWDRPTSTTVDAEVEGMSAGACLCACTGGGGGGGAGAN